MSMPNYSNAEYKKAQDKYNELANQYTGANGMNAAADMANKSATDSAKNIGEATKNQYLNAGYGRARAAREGAQAAANQYGNQYANSYNNAYNANKDTLSAQEKQLEYGKTVDKNKYENASSKWQAGWGIGTGLLGTALNAGGKIAAASMSDENCKDIYSKTSADRCDELLARLRGIE